MLRGGNRYTPIILSESIKKAIAVLDYTQFYEAQYPDYWRTDLSVSYKKNKNKDYDKLEKLPFWNVYKKMN